MKNYIKLFGIIALVAVIGFSMVACDVDDGNEETKPKTFTVSLDKIDAGSFKITLEGGKWVNEGTQEWQNELYGTPRGVTFNPTGDSWEAVRTSNTVLTVTYKGSGTYSGTVTFADTGYQLQIASAIFRHQSSVDTVVIKDGKGSITF